MRKNNLFYNKQQWMHLRLICSVTFVGDYLSHMGEETVHWEWCLAMTFLSYRNEVGWLFYGSKTALSPLF